MIKSNWNYCKQQPDDGAWRPLNRQVVCCCKNSSGFASAAATTAAPKKLVSQCSNQEGQVGWINNNENRWGSRQMQQKRGKKQVAENFLPSLHPSQDSYLAACIQINEVRVIHATQEGLPSFCSHPSGASAMLQHVAFSITCRLFAPRPGVLRPSRSMRGAGTAEGAHLACLAHLDGLERIVVR